MKQESLEIFTNKIKGFVTLNSKDQVDYFAYFLTKNIGDNFTAKQIEQCFEQLSIKKYGRIAAYLSDSSKSRKGNYLKSKVGYKLTRNKFEEMKVIIEHLPESIQVSQKLVGLAQKLRSKDEQTFLDEALSCYSVSAFRATIIMVWILSFSHLQKFIFDNYLAEFNLALASSPDKKISQIKTYDDFSSLSESKIIELAKSAKIISPDVRKILDEKLGIRNTAAHPSAISISGHKTTEFCLDLIDNIVLRY